MNLIKHIFNKIRCVSVLCVVGCVLSVGNAVAETNIPTTGDIGNYGVWATEHNRQLLINNLSTDISSFQGNTQKAIVGDYVPVEARVGKALITALGRVGQALQRSLFDFVRVLLVALFAFWLAFEAYNLIQSKGDAKKLAMDIAKKTMLISIWIWVLGNNPGQIFMTIFGPIISAGSYASDLILNSIASASGTSLPDTCNAIREFIGPDRYTADLLCMPTRLSGFFYTCVAAGFKWMAAGIGTSALTFVAGAAFVVIFSVNIWKFALLAFGVITDLFLATILLPFTAIQECFGKGTNLKGVAGNIFKAFAEMFKAASLNEQIMRFIRAVIYFIVLAIMAAIGAALLGGVVSTDLASATPSVQSDSFMSVLIVGCLVAYLVNKASKFAEKLTEDMGKDKIGGEIDDSFSKQVQGDMKKLWDNTKKQVSDWRKIYQDQKKK